MRRDTDGRLEVFGERLLEGEDRLSVVDRQRQLLFTASRSALSRLGVFRNFDALATMLEAPAPGQRVRRGEASVRVAGVRCSYWHVKVGSAEQRV